MTGEKENERIAVDMGEYPPSSSTSIDPMKRQSKWRLLELGFLFICLAAAAIVGGIFLAAGKKTSSHPSKGSQGGIDIPTDPNLKPRDDSSDGEIKCFENRDELLQAIDGYLGGNRAAVTTVYGSRIGNWCVGGLTDFTAVFRDHRDFNESLDGWDVSQATTFREMFSGCTSFDQDLMWDVSSVTDMSFMFYDASAFTGDISSWNVASVVDMRFMFTRAVAFNGDISGWPVSSLQYMAGFMNGASLFQQDLCDWGSTLPNDHVIADYAFAESGCQVKTTPDVSADPPGPFCNVCV